MVPALPTKLTLSAALAAAEGGPEVTVTATLDAPAPVDGTTVTLTAGGTATLDTDYTLSSTTITIVESETAGTVAVTIIDDTEVDGGETIVLDATSANPPLTAAPLTLIIEDNDVPVPALRPCPHGFRSSLRDWAAEETDHPREVVEAALAHVVRNRVEAAYAKSDLFERRRLLMDDWAAYLAATRRPR